MNPRTRQSRPISAVRGIASGLTASSALQPAIGERDADDGRRDREHQTFGEQLPEQPPARRAQRGAHGVLPRPAIGARDSRFARFAHAMSSTNPTAACSTIERLSHGADDVVA